MKIQDPEKKHAPFDVAAGLAEALVAQGYVKVEPVVPKPTPNLQWKAQAGVREGDYQYPPQIFYSCSTCGTKGWQESQKGTTHQTIVVRHCGTVDRCPEYVAAKYAELFNEWKSRSRKPATKPAVSAWTSNPRNVPITGVQVIPRKPVTSATKA